MDKKILIALGILLAFGGVIFLFSFVENKKRDAEHTEETKQEAELIQQEYKVHPQTLSEDSINFKPIGHFVSVWNTSTGAPRQGILEPDTKATVQVDELYRSALQDLDKFEYIIVIYYFNLTKTWSPLVHPPGSNHNFGLFATRSPKRPNPIGMSVIKLDSVDHKNGILHLSGVDAFKGTPVLDIKPYLPSIDIVQTKKNEQTEKDLGHHDEIFIKDSNMYR